VGSCSGAEKVRKDRTGALPEVPSRYLDDGSGIDARARVTGWPRVAGQAPLEPELYRLEGRILSGRFVVDGAFILPDILDGLLEWDGAKGPGGCPSTPCGTGDVPRGGPVEAAFWLALVDLYRQVSPEDGAVVAAKGRGKLRHLLQDADKAYEGTDESGGLTTSREIISFRASPRMVCEAQVRVFKLDEYGLVNPAAQAAGRTGVHPGNGSHGPEILADGRGQLLLRMAHSDRPDTAAYVMELHLGYDHDQLRDTGETLDLAIRCRSDHPVLADGLAGYGHRCTRSDSGGWTVNVWAE